MAIRFSKLEETSTFLNPLKGFEPTSVKIEMRRDPLTPHRSRLVAYRYKNLGQADLSGMEERSTQGFCPFCPETLPHKAARFLAEWVPEGHIQRGEAVLFPNAFPYEKHNAVCVLCPQHFVPIHGFNPQWITQALLAGQDYFRIIKEKDARAACGSINWNFWPPAGAGLIHPHFQLMATDRPTRYLGEMMARTKRYFRINGRPFGADLVRQEKQRGERYIGQIGKVHWLSAFAPLGVMEIMAFWEGVSDFSIFSEALLGDFAEGLVRVLTYLGSKNIFSLNMAIFILLTEQDHFLPMAKIIPRIELPPLKVSEINYFERLHHESVTFYPPEQVAQELRSFFS